MYVFIGCVFWTDHISLYKLDLSYLYIIITNYDDMYFIVKTHFVLCLLLSNDKFCIHFGGSLEYYINEWMNEKLNYSIDLICTNVCTCIYEYNIT